MRIQPHTTPKGCLYQKYEIQVLGLDWFEWVCINQHSESECLSAVQFQSLSLSTVQSTVQSQQNIRWCNMRKQLSGVIGV